MNLYIYLKTSNRFFSNIPSDLNNLDEYLLPIKDFLKENSRFGDVVLIQGDFGAVYHMVNFSKNLGLKSVYATTNRRIEEILVDEKTIKKSIFEHECLECYI